MKHKRHNSDDKPAETQPAKNGAANETGVDGTPCPDEVARKAYFAYVNEGSPQGRDVQHWLDAEADLIQERDRTRIHGFSNQT
ncbi:MAG: hypothetical protein JWR26_2477 [Pedosphaera sp.]|nr:hypothetical protein [Pedosphaera sp.]